MCDSCVEMKERQYEIKELKRKIEMLQEKLMVAEARLERATGNRLLKSSQADLYPGEQQDFLISILQQIKERCPEESRARDIVESLLSENIPIGCGSEILKEVRRVFKRGEPTSEADIAALKSVGFTYVQSRKHPKLRFYDRYQFVLCCTPSDKRRGAKNKLSDISKCIAVSQKI